MRTADTASSLAVIYLAHVPACAGSSDTDTFGEVKARSIIRSWVLQQVLGLHASAGKPGHGVFCINVAAVRSRRDGSCAASMLIVQSVDLILGIMKSAAQQQCGVLLPSILSRADCADRDVSCQMHVQGRCGQLSVSLDARAMATRADVGA